MAIELNSDIVHTPPLPAATVMLLRDTTQGMEVFLLKRHGLSDVLGGAYVFPGGKVDKADTALDMRTQVDTALPDLHQALNEPDIDVLTAAGLYVAALREVFEESGVLMAHTTGGHDWITAVANDRSPFGELLSKNSLRLQAGSLHPWSRWITPSMPSTMRKRFDTRFFVAIAPTDQVARHDNHETTESVWLAPRQALEQYWQGSIELAPPQIMSLAHLSRFTTAAEALAAAKERVPAVVRPEPHDEDGTRVLCYPGDPRHSVAKQAMPGPTRLYYRNKRFEPALGFEALFS